MTIHEIHLQPTGRPVQKFRVATFADAGETRISKVQAYTLWYNPAWEGCVRFDVWASTGAEAKKAARKARLKMEWDRVRSL